jgi:hypothetical protein
LVSRACFVHGFENRGIWSENFSTLEAPLPRPVVDKLEQIIQEGDDQPVFKEDHERLEALQVDFKPQHYEYGVQPPTSAALEAIIYKISRKLLRKRQLSCENNEAKHHDVSDSLTSRIVHRILYQKHKINVVPIFEVRYQQEKAQEVESMRSISIAALGRPHLAFSVSHMNRNLYPSEQYLDNVRKRAVGINRRRSASEADEYDSGSSSSLTSISTNESMSKSRTPRSGPPQTFWLLKRKSGELEILCPGHLSEESKAQVVHSATVRAEVLHQKDGLKSQTVTLGELRRSSKGPVIPIAEPHNYPLAQDQLSRSVSRERRLRNQASSMSSLGASAADDDNLSTSSATSNSNNTTSNGKFKNRGGVNTVMKAALPHVAPNSAPECIIS